jgi:[protein-PII] uridylyltransferase
MADAKEELRQSRESLLARFARGDASSVFLESYSGIMDHYFRRRLEESAIGQALFRKKHALALVAMGGYGRGELCVHSDIDIMILFGTKIPGEARKLADEFFFPLWDLGLDLGYATRTIKDCLGLAKDDFEVLTSIMDARFVCGDSTLYLTLMDKINGRLGDKKAVEFARWLEDQDKLRVQRFGDASDLLEPNLKEGIGGLRDYHHMLWLARALYGLRAPRDLEYHGQLSHREFVDLNEDLHFIWLTRNHLHQLSGRANDRLSFEYQEPISLRLGFRNEAHTMGVEQFLGRLHATMAGVKAIHRSFSRSHMPLKTQPRRRASSPALPEGLHMSNEQIHFHGATSILSDPLLLFEVFFQSAQTGCELSMEATRLVKEFLFLVDDPFRSARQSVDAFLKIINDPNGHLALDQMHEAGFLETFIPELGHVRDRVQFDTYHIYPVGRHIIETYRYLSTLGQENEILLLDLFSELGDPEPLKLAGIFHDIGKTGNDHARRGATIAEKILNRFGYDVYKTGMILFLIRNHLLLAETATRRDLNDEKVIVQCARIIEDPLKLKMLYLLTWADSRATGPRAWNDWIANLVQELFFKVLHMMETGELATMDAARRASQTESAVRRAMSKTMGEAELNGFMEDMPPRYLLEIGPREVMHHMALVTRLRERLNHDGPNECVIEPKEVEGEGCWTVTFIAMDRPGIFSIFAGVLSLNNINILSAQIYTWQDGTVVDLFKVTHPLDPLHGHDTWRRVEGNLRLALDGSLPLEERLREKSAPSILSVQKIPPRAPSVVIDNASSDFFTVIEVFADDRLGLLFLITSTLFHLGLDIHIAKIATKSDQVADIFYVREAGGEKVESDRREEEIRAGLLQKLDLTRTVETGLRAVAPRLTGMSD